MRRVLLLLLLPLGLALQARRPRRLGSALRAATLVPPEAPAASRAFLDASLGVGYAADGDDWSFAKSSQRPDRPLSNVQLKALTAKSDARGATQLALQLAEIATALAVLVRARALPASVVALSVQFAASLVMGFGLVTLGHCAQHESIHNTAFKSKRLNTAVSWVASLPRLTNPVWEKMLHKDHHTFTNDPRRDPELLANSPANSMPGTHGAYLKNILRLGGGKLGLGVWSARLQILCAGANGDVVGYSGFDAVPRAKASAVRAGLQKSCRLQLAFYAFVVAALATAHGFGAALQFWLVPMLLGEPRLAAPAMNRGKDGTGGARRGGRGEVFRKARSLTKDGCHAFFHAADHLNCAHDYKNGAANARNTLVPAFVGFNLWHMNYHAVHHLYPSIPQRTAFHALPEAHALLEGHFEHESPSALHVHRDALRRWLPHYRTRLAAFGIAGVEQNWEPCAPDHVRTPVI
ncbi:hypothetical protein M885DRAFT_627020 [Pelagophyceae sp. CCMP2097]|nr:hypothetical protein M885DRAFT_627020 [Pelagophyceae sp. CCMP2097]